MTKSGAGPKQFEDLLAVMPYATVIVDQQGRIAMANSLAEQLFGYGRDEMLGRPVEILMPERFRDQHIQLRAGYAVDPQLRPMGAGLELYGRRQDGSEFPAEIALSPSGMQTSYTFIYSSPFLSLKKMQRTICRRRG